MTFQCHQICMTFGKQTLSYSCLLGVLFVCQMLPTITLTHFTWFTIACSRNCCYSLSIIVVLTVWHGMKFSHCSTLANACSSSPFQLHSAPPTALHHTLHGEVGVRQVAVGSRPGALITRYMAFEHVVVGELEVLCPCRARLPLPHLLPTGHAPPYICVHAAASAQRGSF